MATGWTLLDFDLRGRVYRFTDSPTALEVTDRDGEVWLYRPGLAGPGLRRGMTSASFTLSARMERSWHSLAGDGWLLEQCDVVVRRWYSGVILERATVYLRGRSAQVVYGADHEPLGFSVVSDRTTEGMAGTYIIDENKWPRSGVAHDPDPSVLGATGPVVFGQPQDVPAYLVEYDNAVLGDSMLLVAAHHVEAATVTVRDAGGSSEWTATITNTEDAQGNPVALADFDVAAGAPRATPDREYRTDWTADGISTDGAADTIEWLIQHHSKIKLDRGYFGTWRSAINAASSGTWSVVAPASTWSVVQKIAKTYGLEAHDADGGVYWRLPRLRATREEAKGHLDAGPSGSVVRTSQVQYVGQVYNEFTVQYGVGGNQSREQEYVVAGAAVQGDDPWRSQHLLCRISQSYYGHRPMKPVKYPEIPDQATAMRLASRLADAHALPRRAFTVEGSPEVLRRYADEDVITISASDVSLEEEIGVLRDIEDRGDVISATVVVLSTPPQRGMA